MSVWTNGIIARPSSSVPLLDDLKHSEKKGDFELQTYIDVKEEELELGNGVRAQSGLAAKEIVKSKEVIEVTDGHISVTDTEEKEWRWTRFWFVTEGNPSQFIVVKDSGGKFFFDIIEQRYGSDIDVARFDLDDIVQDHPGQWTGTFEDRQDNVRNGTLYGDDIERDTDMGRPYSQSDKSVIGPIIPYDGTDIKAKINDEGWVQIVSPGNYGRINYLKFIKDMLLQYSQ